MAIKMELPDFLKNQSVEEIHNQMLGTIPDSIAKEENGWVSDITLPTAIQKAELVQFQLIEMLQTIFPQYSNYYLDEHAFQRGIIRRPATYSQGTISIKGKPKTSIPKGFLFSTAATLDNSGVVFVLDKEMIVPESGEIDAEITAQNIGTSGNVAAESISLMVKPLAGITGITNAMPTYGGFEEENDESLRKRIIEYDKVQGLSFVGSISDYTRWAYEVAGVGNVKVIPANDDTGLVKIVVIDLNGDPANTQICNNIYNYIMRPDNPLERLAPINANLSVIPPTVIEIAVTANVKLEDGYDLKNIIEEFVKRAKLYLKTVHDEIRYTEIGAALVGTEGILDYQNLLVNGSTSNIEVMLYALPFLKTENVVLTA